MTDEEAEWAMWEMGRSLNMTDEQIADYIEKVKLAAAAENN